MKLIVGLGNPGDKYEMTRHNLGFSAIDHLFKDFASVRETVWTPNDKFRSVLAQIDWQPQKRETERVILAKPQTYMNNSGMAVHLLASFYKIEPENIWIVYDELDLPLGTIKIRFGGAAAGHHGVESIMQKIGTDKFWRFRLGIGENHHHAGRAGREDGKEVNVGRRKYSNAEEFVLSPFTAADRGKVKNMLKHGSKALELALEKGLEAAMNRYNN